MDECGRHETKNVGFSRVQHAAKRGGQPSSQLTCRRSLVRVQVRPLGDDTSLRYDSGDAMVKVLSVSSAHPPYRVSPDELASYLRASLTPSSAIGFVLDNSEVRSRYTVLPLSDLLALRTIDRPRPRVRTCRDDRRSGFAPNRLSAIDIRRLSRILGPALFRPIKIRERVDR